LESYSLQPGTAREVTGSAKRSFDRSVPKPELGNEVITFDPALPPPSIRRFPSVWVGGRAAGEVNRIRVERACHAVWRHADGGSRPSASRLPFRRKASRPAKRRPCALLDYRSFQFDLVPRRGKPASRA